MKKQWLIGLLLIVGCAGPGGLFGETAGEKFRKALSNVDAVCKERKIGPYLDLADPEYRRKSALTNCDVLKIKPFDLNAAMATSEGKYAYSIQLPTPLAKSRVKRADYRSADEYFQALCEKEAGDYKFRTVENVDGIAVHRATERLTNSLGSYSDETQTFTGGSSPEERFLTESTPYLFLERPLRVDERRQQADGNLSRFTRDMNRDMQKPDRGLIQEKISKFSARYGYTWRGLEVLNDRESGITGGDLIVFDLTTSEVLGVRRNFSKTEPIHRDRPLPMRSRHCMPHAVDGFGFVFSVLAPINR